MESGDKGLQDPTVTHRLFQLITDMSDDERRTLLKLIDEGLLRGKCRRGHFRKRMRLPLAYANKDAVYQNMTRDISLGGVFICTSIPFQVGDELRILFKTQEKGGVKILGKVARTSKEGIGVRFLSMNDDRKTALMSLTHEP